MIMTLTQYTEITKTLVKNQARLVEECGYCISWDDTIQYYGSVEEYTAKIRKQIQGFALNEDVDFDITLDEVLEIYGL